MRAVGIYLQIFIPHLIITEMYIPVKLTFLIYLRKEVLLSNIFSHMPVVLEPHSSSCMSNKALQNPNVAWCTNCNWFSTSTVLAFNCREGLHFSVKFSLNGVGGTKPKRHLKCVSQYSEIRKGIFNVYRSTCVRLVKRKKKEKKKKKKKS